MNALVEQITWLSAEIDKLRVALHRIAELRSPSSEVGKIAREALRTPSLNEASEGLTKEE